MLTTLQFISISRLHSHEFLAVLRYCNINTWRSTGLENLMTCINLIKGPWQVPKIVVCVLGKYYPDITSLRLTSLDMWLHALSVIPKNILVLFAKAFTVLWMVKKEQLRKLDLKNHLLWQEKPVQLRWEDFQPIKSINLVRKEKKKKSIMVGL